MDELYPVTYVVTEKIEDGTYALTCEQARGDWQLSGWKFAASGLFEWVSYRHTVRYLNGWQ